MPSMTQAELDAFLARQKKAKPITADPATWVPPIASPEPVHVSARVTMQKTTDEAKLNKTEARYLARLRMLKFPWIGVQNITLKLADDCRYSPDFWVINADGELEAHETKGGFIREDSTIKLKVAARQFPFIRFILCELHKGEWTLTHIKP
jgi:hypothetical protein